MANDYRMVDDKLVQLTNAEQKELDARNKAWTDGQAERDSTKYQRDREVAYPPIGDQLDALYHGGVFPKEMTDILKAVKDKYPKG